MHVHALLKMVKGQALELVKESFHCFVSQKCQYKECLPRVHC